MLELANRSKSEGDGVAAGANSQHQQRRSATIAGDQPVVKKCGVKSRRLNSVYEKYYNICNDVVVELKNSKALAAASSHFSSNNNNQQTSQGSKPREIIDSATVSILTRIISAINKWIESKDGRDVFQILIMQICDPLWAAAFVARKMSFCIACASAT